MPTHLLKQLREEGIVCIGRRVHDLYTTNARRLYIDLEGKDQDIMSTIQLADCGFDLRFSPEANNRHGYTKKEQELIRVILETVRIIIDSIRVEGSHITTAHNARNINLKAMNDRKSLWEKALSEQCGKKEMLVMFLSSAHRDYKENIPAIKKFVSDTAYDRNLIKEIGGFLPNTNTVLDTVDDYLLLDEMDTGSAAADEGRSLPPKVTSYIG